MRAKPIELTVEEKEFLERMVGSSTAEQRQVFRAGLILLSSAGLAGNEIARRMDCRTATVSKWRQRFLHRRIEGLNRLRKFDFWRLKSAFREYAVKRNLL